MQKAYIILAHKNPQQLHRLIKALDDNTSAFFIHIDKKSDFDTFQTIQQPMVTWVDRVEANWGEFGLVEATLNALKAIRAAEKTFDRIILLSGQDYPIKSNDVINEYLRASSQSNFIEYHSLPSHAKWKPNGGLYRVNKYFFGLRFHQQFAAKVMNFLAILFPRFQRTIPDGMKPYAGSMWWIIDDYSLQYILNYVEKNPEYINFHKSTFAADEVFFHMLLLNAGDDKLSLQIANDDKRFIKWKDIYASHPEKIKEVDLEEMQNSNALFARKFDLAEDLEILNTIDLHRARDGAE